MTKSWASRAMARRISTFCWSATVSVRASLPPGRSIPDDSTSRAKRRPVARRSTIVPSTPRYTFSCTERCGTSVGSWAMIVIPSRSESRGER